MTVSELLGKFDCNRTIQCELHRPRDCGYSGVFNVDEWDDILEDEWKNAYINSWDIEPSAYAPTLVIFCG